MEAWSRYFCESFFEHPCPKRAMQYSYAMTRRDFVKPAFSLRIKRFVKTHALSLLGTTRLLSRSDGALSTVKNGPRLWTVDYVGVMGGKERDFQGLKARWVMWFPIPDAIREGKDLSYQVMHANRDTSMSIDKGSRAYILDDPQGVSWVMKSASLIKDPNQKFEDLKVLGSRLKLPPGWKFRSPILEQELVFMTDNGKTQITQDELGNTYDRTGGPYSNYKP